MDVTDDTAALVAFTGRIAGSDAERRAALCLRDRLRARGREAVLEPFRFHQRWGLAQAIALAAAVVGSVLAVTRPGVGLAIVAVAAACSILESSGALQLLRRLTGTRASQNVFSRADGERDGVLVLAAAYDAPRESALGRLAGRFGAPWLAIDAALVAVLACCAIRLIGLEGTVLTAIQLIPTLLLLAAIPLLVDAELAPIGDGAAEAAGVATAIAIAERLDGELPHLDVWLVLCGAGGSLGAGMRAWRRRHRGALRERRVATIEVGAPEPSEVEQVAELYADLARQLDAELAESLRLRPA